MKKYIVNYIYVCLVTLIVTSLLYIVNNDIKEHFDYTNPNTGAEDNTRKNLIYIGKKAYENRIGIADDVYRDYWRDVQMKNGEALGKFNNCNERFMSFMFDIKDKINEENEEHDLCKNYTDNDYFTLDLTDTGRNGRIKGTCLKDIIENNKKGLSDLVDNYKENSTSEDRCYYVQNNYPNSE